MSRRVELHGSIAVVSEGLKQPELHLAIHNAFGPICDCCSLQADCDAFFGRMGSNCQIHHKGERWVQVPQPTLETLKTLI